MPSWKERLSPWLRKRRVRLEAYLRTEENNWAAEIDRRVRERNEQTKAIDMALFQERREPENHLINRQLRMLPMLVAWERGVIEGRIALRKRLAAECPELLRDSELNGLEASMLRGVRSLRQARRDSYLRKTAAAGARVFDETPSEKGEWGELEAMVRREVAQLRLARRLGRVVPVKQGWSRETKIAVWSISVGVVIAIAATLVQIFGPEIRAAFGLK